MRVDKRCELTESTIAGATAVKGILLTPLMSDTIQHALMVRYKLSANVTKSMPVTPTTERLMPCGCESAIQASTLYFWSVEMRTSTGHVHYIVYAVINSLNIILMPETYSGVHILAFPRAPTLVCIRYAGKHIGECEPGISQSYGKVMLQSPAQTTGCDRRACRPNIQKSTSWLCCQY